MAELFEESPQESQLFGRNPGLLKGREGNLLGTVRARHRERKLPGHPWLTQKGNSKLPVVPPQSENDMGCHAR